MNFIEFLYTILIPIFFFIGFLFCAIYLMCTKCFCKKKTRQQSQESSLELPPCRTFTDSMLNINVREQWNDSGAEEDPYSLGAAEEGRFYDCQEEIEDEDPQEGPSRCNEQELITTEELVRNLV